MKKIIMLLTMLASKEAYAKHQYVGLGGSVVSFERENRKDTSSSTNYENTRTTKIDLNFMYGISLHKNIALQMDLGLLSAREKEYKGKEFTSTYEWDASLGSSLVFSFKPNAKVNPIMSLGGGFIMNGYNSLGTSVQDFTGYKLYAQAGLGLEIALKNSKVKYRPMISGKYTYAMGDNKKFGSAGNTGTLGTDVDSKYSWHILFTMLSFTVAF